MKSLLLVLIAVVAVVTGAVVHDRDCSYNCPYHYDPVCGSDGNTYPNMCVLEGENQCHNPNLTLAHKGECDTECPIGCPDIWEPVCGSDGKTYPNMCELNRTITCYDPELTLDHKGECEVEDKECPYACTEEYVPVCGSDGKTYPNMCELNRTIDCYNPDLTFDHNGECGATDPDCPRGCYENWDPVCGNDGNTYGNLCMLEEERDCNGKPDLALDYEGECTNTPRR